MVSQIIYFQLLGISVLQWIGIVGLVLLLIAGVGGYLQMKGKLNFSIKTHMFLGVVGLAFALAHGLLVLLF